MYLEYSITPVLFSGIFFPWGVSTQQIAAPQPRQLPMVVGNR